MSVLKCRRGESKAQFIQTAREICWDVMWFVTRLSARYARYISENVIRLAREVREQCMKANSIYPSDVQRVELRAAHILEARAALAALDDELGDIYEFLMHNPQGCFTTASGKVLSASTAKEKIDKRAQALGEKIDHEERMLTALLKSDKTRVNMRPAIDI